MFPGVLLWTSREVEFSATDTGSAVDETDLAGFRRIEEKFCFGYVDFHVHIRYPAGNTESSLEERPGGRNLKKLMVSVTELDKIATKSR